MFRCYFCKRVTPPKTTRHSVVIETREKNYVERRREPKRRGFRDREESVRDRGGKGIETIREVDACPECAAEQQRQQVASVSQTKDISLHDDASSC